MVEIKNMLQLQVMCSNIVKEVLEEIIEEYRNELADFIQEKVYNGYTPTWEGRTGEFGANIDKNYKINKKGNQYYRSMEIEIADTTLKQTDLLSHNGTTADHNPMTYQDLFNIIEEGYTTDGVAYANFPSHMDGRLFVEDFRNHVKDTLKGRFVAKCIEKGIPSVIAGSIIVDVE
jgi:hypothetical protein